ncbi:MAG: chemotaxis protein CheW, partial [Phycisphaerae bacterium]|nr:chemotaxis protein CheW [Gemmatimonadaceae bacterium]
EDQWFGIPVASAQEVLLAQRIAPVPLAPDDIPGFLNLRGQIVTAMDLRRRLDFAPRSLEESSNIVVRQDGELFSLLVDEVGDVLSVRSDAVEPVPQALGMLWRQICSGIVRQDRGLLVVVNVGALLRIESTIAA